MFLSENKGSSKINVIKRMVDFLRKVCNKYYITFDITLVKVSAYRGVAATKFKETGTTTLYGKDNLNFKSPKRQSY